VLATLLLLADGRFPAGGHAHSGGAEAACAAGDVTDVDSLARYVEGRLETTGTVEAAFAAAACAAAAGGAPRWTDLDRELAARTPSPALRRASRTLGRQMLRAGARTWPSPTPPGPHDVHPDGPLQPLALGAVAHRAGLRPDDAARCALHHLLTGMTSAALRVLGLDPFEVSRLHATMAPRLERLATLAAGAAHLEPPSLPARSGLLVDVLAEHHSTWEVRLFAS